MLFESGNEIPEFLYMEEVSLQTLDAEGANTHQIDNIWVFDNGASIGVYELPAQLLVIPQAENNNLLFLAGVRINGINSSAGVYPFYEGIELNRPLIAGNSDTLSLDFQYKSESIFALIEDFEANHVFQVDRDGNPETSVSRSEQEASTGIRSGLIQVSEMNPLAEVASSTIIEGADVAGKALFLELEYKNEVELKVGLVGMQGIESFENLKLGLRPRDDWNKVYIDLAPEISVSQLEQYRVFFSVQYSGNGGDAQNVYIDNVKLIHF
jgi:hypothetical protein